MDVRELPGLRGRIAGGGRIGVAWLALGSPAVAEIAATAGPDALVIDMQHGLWDRTSLEAAVGAARAYCPVLVRVEENGPVPIGRALDAGADGVIVPLVESADEAAMAVRAARFPPHGARSGGGVRPLAGGFAAHLAAAEGHLVVVMVETWRGVDNAAGIAATAGVDAVLVGTGDLLLSYAGDPDPAARREEGCAAVLRATRDAGVAAGIFTPDPATARARMAEGWAIAVLANDIDVVRSGFSSAVAAT